MKQAAPETGTARPPLDADPERLEAIAGRPRHGGAGPRMWRWRELMEPGWRRHVLACPRRFPAKAHNAVHGERQTALEGRLAVGLRQRRTTDHTCPQSRAMRYEGTRAVSPPRCPNTNRKSSEFQHSPLCHPKATGIHPPRALRILRPDAVGVSLELALPCFISFWAPPGLVDFPHQTGHAQKGVHSQVGPATAVPHPQPLSSLSQCRNPSHSGKGDGGGHGLGDTATDRDVWKADREWCSSVR
jgi:hypothetical protein